MPKLNPYNRRFADFVADDPSLKDALAKAMKFVADLRAHPHQDGYCLTLAGKSGTGKTMLTEIVLAELGFNAWGVCAAIPTTIRGGRLCQFTGAMFNLRKVSEGFKEGRFGVVEAMEEKSLAVLDDLGADHDPSRLMAAKVDQVLRRRQRLWTLITVNLSLQEIADKIDGRIASFIIRDHNRFIEIQSEDFAKRKFRKAA